MSPVDDDAYTEAMELDARWADSIETSKGYFEKTGRLPSIEQMEYWFRGGKATPKVPRHFLEQGLGIAAEEMGVNLAYRYTIVARVAGTDIAKRKYEIEWTLIYYAPYKLPFRIALNPERRAARAVLGDIAYQHGSWVPDKAVAPDYKAERVPTGIVRQTATFKVTDATRTTTNMDGEEVSYSKVFKLNNADVLRQLRDHKIDYLGG